MNFKLTETYKFRLARALAGYRNELDDNDDIVIIALDAATTGRLSVTYYNELRSSDFYDRIKSWGDTCRWYFWGKDGLTVDTPKIKQLIACAFGTEQTEKGKERLTVKDGVMKEQVQRVLSCILDTQYIPYDIVHALSIRASNPEAFKEKYNYEKTLSVACAVTAKYYKTKGANVKMTLDSENRDRSYLFGRLLAVMEKVEAETLRRTENDRATNASRLQSAYVNHPFATWKTLEGQLVPYFNALTPYLREKYKTTIAEIVEKLYDTDEASLNRPLTEMYLIGYYLQRAELNRYIKKNDNNKEKK